VYPQWSAIDLGISHIEQRTGRISGLNMGTYIFTDNLEPEIVLKKRHASNMGQGAGLLWGTSGFS
jgi:hypothetical protein